ncbi:MAG: AI-2E family transporter [Chromatiaceae bacterium]
MDTGFTPVGRFLLVAGAFVVVVAGMRAASALLTPFLLASFIAVIAAPPMFYLKRRGAPNWLALLAVSAVMVAIGGLVVVLVSESVGAFTANLPEYEGRLRQLSLHFVAWLDHAGLHLSAATLTTYLNAGRAMQVAGALLSGLADALTNAVLILLTVVFILLEASSLPAKLQRMLRRPEVSMERLEKVLDRINRYMALKTTVSLVTGVTIGVGLWLLGVDFPVLWGLVAFLFNFVPTIGSIIAAVPAVLLALVQLGPTTALWAGLGYLVVNLILGNVIEPKFMGRGLGLSTLVVFVSLVFWGWVLGAVGMFLSVPLTGALAIAFDASAETRPLAILLGPEFAEPEDVTDDGRGT